MRPRHLIIIAAIALAVGFIFASPAWAFSLEKGIVGNLECAESGNCSFCDFIYLFVILQKVILSLFGGLAIIMLIGGGQGIITAAGNQQKVAESKKLITSTLLGVVIILAAYFLIVILVGILTGTNPSDKSLFGKNWSNAFCTPSDSPAYCVGKADGSNCTVTISQGTGNGVCKNEACITGCQYEWGSSGYTCKDVSTCNPAIPYFTGLCPGPENIVCCI